MIYSSDSCAFCIAYSSHGREICVHADYGGMRKVDDDRKQLECVDVPPLQESLAVSRRGLAGRGGASAGTGKGRERCPAGVAWRAHPLPEREGVQGSCKDLLTVREGRPPGL